MYHNYCYEEDSEPCRFCNHCVHNHSHDAGHKHCGGRLSNCKCEQYAPKNNLKFLESRHSVK